MLQALAPAARVRCQLRIPGAPGGADSTSARGRRRHEGLPDAPGIPLEGLASYQIGENDRVVASQPRVASSSLCVALSIAGSDSGAGAGIQADLLTFAALGVFGTTAITCLTAQNPDGVTDVHAAPAGSVAAQIEAVARYYRIRAAKTGMLFNTSIIAEVVAFFREHRDIRLVVDPVMVATSGAMLLQEDAVESMARDLCPLATLVTPNLDEAAVLLGWRPKSRAELIEAAHALSRRFKTAVLLKGGHLPGMQLCDVLASPKGSPSLMEGRRILRVDTHGSGCTLSAAIAAHLAKGAAVEEAVAGGRRYLRRGMARPLKVGRRRFIAH